MSATRRTRQFRDPANTAISVSETPPQSGRGHLTERQSCRSEILERTTQVTPLKVTAVTSCDSGAPKHQCRVQGQELQTPPAYEEKYRLSLEARALQERAPPGRARKRGPIVVRRNGHRI